MKHIHGIFPLHKRLFIVDKGYLNDQTSGAPYVW